MIRSLFLLIGVFFPVVASAAVPADICLELARSMARGQQENFNTSEITAMQKYSRCEASNSSKSTGVDIGVKAYTLGYDGSSSSNSNICEKSASDLGISLASYNKASILFEQTLGTINQCLQAAGDSWVVNFQNLPVNGFAVGVGHAGDPGGTFRGARIIPSDGLECSGLGQSDGAAVNTVINNSRPLNIVCTLKQKKADIGGETYDYADDATLVLNLGNTPVAFPVNGYPPRPISELNQKIAELDARLGELQAIIDNSDESPEGGQFVVRTLIGNARGPLEGECPKGSYISSIRVIENVTGEYGVDGIRALRLTCRGSFDSK